MSKTEIAAVKTENTAKAAPVVVLKTVLEPEAKAAPVKAEKPAEKPEAKAAPVKAEESAEKAEAKAVPAKSEKSPAEKPETKVATAKAEKSSADKSEVKAVPAKSEESSAEKPEAKVATAKAENPAEKPEAKAAPAKAEESAAEKPETKAAPAKSEESSAEKLETKAATVKAEKPTADKPEAKAAPAKSEKSSAPKQEAKPEPAKAEKPAPKARPKAVLAKPEAKTESLAQAAKPESSALEKAAPHIASVSNPPVPNPPAVSEKPTVQVVDSPLKRMKQEFTERTNVIKQEMRNIQNSFLVIGFQLHWIKTNNMYKVLNYKNISEYAEKEFGIKKSTCSNFINIIETYAERDENGEVIESIAECYRNFSSSQLIAMIGMPEEMQQQVTPDMSVRTINRLRKGEPEQPPVDAPKAVISEAKPTASMPVHEVMKPAAPVPVHEAPKPAAPVLVHEALKSAVSETAHEVPKPMGTVNNPAANNISKPLENHVPRTLLEIESYSGYRSVVDKIDKLMKEAFKAGKRMKVKLVCEEG